MYVKLNMYDALTYVMGRTCLRRHVHARERCVWLHSRMFYLVRFVSLPRDARKQHLPCAHASSCGLAAPRSPHCFDIPRTCECMIRRVLHGICCRHALVLVRRPRLDKFNLSYHFSCTPFVTALAKGPHLAFFALAHRAAVVNER